MAMPGCSRGAPLEQEYEGRARIKALNSFHITNSNPPKKFSHHTLTTPSAYASIRPARLDYAV